MPAQMIVEGQALVVRSITPEMAALAKPGILGKPLIETYVEPEYAPILALMKMVMTLGISTKVDFVNPYGLRGVVWLRLEGPDQVWFRYRPLLSQPRETVRHPAMRALLRSAPVVAAMAAALPLLD